MEGANIYPDSRPIPQVPDFGNTSPRIPPSAELLQGHQPGRSFAESHLLGSSQSGHSLKVDVFDPSVSTGRFECRHVMSWHSI